MSYKIQKDGFGQEYLLIDTGNGFRTISFDPANTDYQEYLKWLSEGNEPLEADA